MNAGNTSVTRGKRDATGKSSGIKKAAASTSVHALLRASTLRTRKRRRTTQTPMARARERRAAPGSSETTLAKMILAEATCKGIMGPEIIVSGTMGATIICGPPWLCCGRDGRSGLLAAGIRQCALPGVATRRDPALSNPPCPPAAPPPSPRRTSPRCV